MVNRIWRWHFGRGSCHSTDNFGALGDRPDAPRLLDWLARRFVESGWSIKAMHRLIMLSSTYQMQRAVDDHAARVDPENRLHWRANVGGWRPRRSATRCWRSAARSTGTMGGSLLARQEPRLPLRPHLEGHDQLRQPAAVGVPAGRPEPPVRRVPAVRLPRRRRAQRRPGDHDRRPAGAVPDEQRAHDDGAGERLAESLLGQTHLDDARQVPAAPHEDLRDASRPCRNQTGCRRHRSRSRAKHGIARWPIPANAAMKSGHCSARASPAANEFVYVS